MILQNCIGPDEVCRVPEIYYRSSGELSYEYGNVLLCAGQELSSNTYMNMFDVGAWNKYTTVNKISFYCQIKGKGRIALLHQENNIKKKIKEVSYGSERHRDQPESEMLTVQIDLPAEIRSGMIYFSLNAESETQLCHAEFRTKDSPDRRISLSLVICTYKRKAYLERNIEKIKRSPMIRKLAEENCFVARVVDNARELSDSYGRSIKVYPNENTGGSGGFTRGMEESVKEKEEYQTTHVILMDDDVELQTESLGRLYALLSYIRPEYSLEAIAGRMFRLDRRESQYTAAEIWNGGDLRHIGWNQDMSLEENLPSMNENEGAEYGGWWFACYPMEFVEKNRPLPFFLHCDDVEYGLRHGGTPIVLNGIQVWHETYEYRQSPVIVYYDTRNTLIVNKLMGESQPKEVVMGNWKKKLSFFHVQKDYLSERMAILGMLDYIRNGQKFFSLQRNHEKIFKKRYFLKWTNKVLWRMTEALYQIKFR